ncbi:MAG: RecX family transcriptional regulator [Candidatus Cloacimonetes bacterium]|nr:RecX family transcriptional regulator [Candidatus Cloacimonadota bacterium]
MMNYSFYLKPGKKSIFVIQRDGVSLGTLPRSKLILFLNTEDKLDISDNNEAYLREELLRYGRERLFKFLAYRDRSVKETKQFLKELPLSKEFVDELMGFCLDKGFLNDKRYAEMFVMSARDNRMSKREVRFKLREKGIGNSYVESAISEFYPETDEKQNLRELVDYAFRRYKCEDTRKHKSKCIEYLIRKGYEYYNVKAEIDKVFGSDDNDFEF